jgi:isopenicillin-N epimerase
MHRRGISVAVDGPHALAQVPVDLEAIGCDFYTASCHKWLSAPFGSGLLYVAPAWQPFVRPLSWSWGVLPPDVPSRWWQEFVWMGTRDPSAFLSVPTAIDWLQQIGFEAFRKRTHCLAQHIRNALIQRFGGAPLMPDDPVWYGSMAHVPLPPSAPSALQQRLWHDYHIEVPVVEWNGDRYLRISCHLYNTLSDLERLEKALIEVVG